jgi:hypothetical protein
MLPSHATLMNPHIGALDDPALFDHHKTVLLWALLFGCLFLPLATLFIGQSPY